MEIQLNLSSFIHLTAVILGLLVAAILWTYPRGRTYPYRRWLGGYFGLVAIGLGIAYSHETGLTFQMPHLYRTANIFGWLIMPVSYLYVRSVLQQRSPGKLDLLHAVPAVFYIIDMLPFFVLPGPEKAAALRQTFGDMNVLLSFSEAWITPPYFHIVARNIQYAVYWLLQVWLLRKLYRIKERRIFFRENREWLRFVYIFIGFQFLFIFPVFFVFIFDFSQSIWLVSEVSIALSMVFSAFVLFFRPEMLYGIQGVIEYPEQENDEAEAPTYLDSQTVQELKEKLNDLMDREQPYLNSGYSLGGLSRDLDIPSYKMTDLLNKGVGLNFNDCINQHRINYCRKKLESGEWNHLTIEGMAEKCGFNHRNTFTRAFKKFTGKTPGRYLQAMKA